MTFYVWHRIYRVGEITSRFPDGHILAYFPRSEIQEKLAPFEYKTFPHDQERCIN